jgi:hypothetical protein
MRVQEADQVRLLEDVVGIMGHRVPAGTIGDDGTSRTVMDDHAMREQSLEQIDGKPWGDPPADATRLVAAVHRLRQVPIRSLDAEGLRLLIGQHQSLDALVPLAIERLEVDPLAEGDYYPGDLLAAVLAVPADHWHANPQQRDRLSPVLDAVTDPHGELHEDVGFDVDQAAASFRAATAR